jgi:surfeit locus 1 family protein
LSVGKMMCPHREVGRLSPCVSFSSTASRKKGGTLGLFVFGGIVCATGSLGVWQLKRYKWKSELVAKRRMSLDAPATQLSKLPTTDEEVQKWQYKPISVEGVFDHSREILVGPRSPPKERTGGMGLADVKGETAGFYVVTPLVIGKGTVQEERVLVNRGWIPASFVAKSKDSYALSESQKRFVEGPVKVTGILTEGEERNTFSPPNDVQARRFLWFELEQLSKASQSFPLAKEAKTNELCFLASTKSHNAGEFPICRPIKAYNDFYTTTDTHLIYAGTWFSLATFGTFMTYVRFLK